MRTRFKSIGIKQPIPTENLALWLRADRGVVLDTTSTPTVSQWLDQSGNGRHATQTTKASQPTLISSSVNSRPAIRFVNGFLTFTISNITDKLEAFTVFKRLGEGTTPYSGVLSLYSNGNDFDNVESAAVFLDLPGTVFGSFRVNTLSNTSSRVDNIGILASTSFDGSQNILTYNGVTSTPVASTGNFSYTKGRVGMRQNNEIYNGEVCELLIYHNKLSVLDRNRITNYLKTKYSV